MLSNKKIAVFAAGIAACASSVAFAASMNAQGNVLNVQASQDSKWGGCLVDIDANYSRLNCSQKYISMDCAGVVEGNTKAAGQRRFDVALLGMMTNTPIKVKIFDNVKINGYCYADRVQLAAPAGAAQ
jgi:hypothetical protein